MTDGLRGTAPSSRIPRAATAVEKSIERGAQIGSLLLNPDYEPSATRLRDLGVTPDLHSGILSDELVSMGQVFTAENGGSLRTFSGGLPHECGWWPAFKARRLQHWEGISALNFIIESETNHDVAWLQSEGIAFLFYLAPQWFEYTADALMNVNGIRHVVEIKRRASDLRDPEYRMKLAAVAEICRRCGWIFRVVLAPEIYAGRLHEENCRLFTDRRFVHVNEYRLDLLEGFAIRRGHETTYGELAEAIAPGAVPLGEAIIQALTIRRRLRVDLTARLYRHTPITIL